MTTKSSPVFYELREKFYPDFDGKVVPESMLNQLDDLGVAVWIMDDGSIKKTGNGENTRPYIRLYTCAFDTEDNQRVVAFFEKKYSVTPKVLREEKNPYLVFSADDTEVLLKKLLPYIKFNGKTKEWVAESTGVGYPDRGCIYLPVIKKSYAKRVVGGGSVKTMSALLMPTDEMYEEPVGKYDIEVEDNHNFIYNNVVVHNCAESLALRKAFPKLLSSMYSQEELDRSSSFESEEVKVQKGFDRLMSLIEKLTITELQDYIKKITDSDKYTKAQKKEYIDVANKQIEKIKKELESEAKNEI